MEKKMKMNIYFIYKTELLCCSPESKHNIVNRLYFSLGKDAWAKRKKKNVSVSEEAIQILWEFQELVNVLRNLDVPGKFWF